MLYRTIGTTGVAVSEIGFGCGGNAGLMVRGGFDEQCRIVARALELGINYFDNAPDYGDGAAEENLGRVLKALHARPLINSKVEVRARDLDDIAGHVVRSAEESLRRLGIDCLDFLQIHNGPRAGPTTLEGRGYKTLSIDDFMRPGGALEGLRRVLRDGKARHIGFICRGGDAREVKALLDTRLFSMINVSYTLLNPTAGMRCPTGLEVDRDGGNVLGQAATRGTGAAIFSALAGGFLTDESVAGADRHPLARAVDREADATREAQRKAARLLPIAVECGWTLAQAAYRFVLSHPGVTTVLGGFSALSQVDELCAVSGAPPLNTRVLNQIDALWRSNFAAA
ncbi:aldo/keto reductase [Paraburkholderia sp. LEh10]|uniref:aldo/keto reductase n=1 Tax=Paraburkholderia sp. LEh10 TaxID=2821353 RepID=UPI001AE7BA79|nr:aldo/keto reductase [Paraburkholderia sp. LEh10]MBP0592146.1 aldo/keto reductase [Paraburkholderia sp. LEh10]